MQRSSGILLPLASLPSPYGIGDFGPSAHKFVDFLSASGQREWMILPLTIPDSLGSPFASPSSFALNWMLISPDVLMQQKLLTATQARTLHIRAARIPYRMVYQKKRTMLRWAWKTFQKSAIGEQRIALKKFRIKNRAWLEPYALYAHVKRKQKHTPWYAWPAKLRNHDADTLAAWKQAHANDLALYAFEQWIAFEQWQTLKTYAYEHGIRFIGNLPFFVPHDSVDIWSNRHAFRLKKNGALKIVAGAPPDQLAPGGQKWGYPLYHWRNVRKKHFILWKRRIARTLYLYDRVILDHFRGYVSVWGVRAHAADAGRGHWHQSPGKRLLRALPARASGRLVAEDLGHITDRVRNLQERGRIWGMRIVQTGFDDGDRDWDLPKNYPARSVVLTGTHDQHTAGGWLQTANINVRKRALKLVDATPATFSQQLIRYGMHSKAGLFVAPLQDWLQLDDRARTNLPGTKRNNWQWRVPANALTARLARTIRATTRQAQR